MRTGLALVVPLCLSAAAGGISLPTPTGLSKVGRQMLYWSDPKRPETAGPTTGKPREIVAYVYYPAVATGNHVEYYPGLAGLEDAAETRILRQQFGGAWRLVTSQAIETNSFDAPPLAGRTKFPILIFSPGGQAPVLAYQILFEELASHGYVIFALEHGADSALLVRPDGTLLPHFNRRPADTVPTIAYLESVRDESARRAADISFSLDRIGVLAEQAGSVFYKRLDLSRIGVFGHSAGGQAAIRTCQIDARVSACLNQDGEMFGIPLGSSEAIPTLLPGRTTLAPVQVIYVAEPGATDAQLAAVKVTRKQYDDWRANKNLELRTFLKLNSQESDLVTITLSGFVHASFLDVRLLTANPNPEAVQNHRTAANITRAFFDARLRQLHESWRRIATAPGEGITVERLGSRR